MFSGAKGLQVEKEIISIHGIEEKIKPHQVRYYIQMQTKTDEKTWDPLQGLYQCKEVGSRQAHNSHTVLFGKSKVFLEFIL